MSMDKLFDGSDAHLLSGNAELIERLNEPELYYHGNFDTVRRANALLSGLCQEAADALAAADKRITELEQVNCSRLDEAERKLAVVREALNSIEKNTCCGDCQEAKKVAQKALAQIGGEDAG